MRPEDQGLIYSRALWGLLFPFVFAIEDRKSIKFSFTSLVPPCYWAVLFARRGAPVIVYRSQLSDFLQRYD